MTTRYELMPAHGMADQALINFATDVLAGVITHRDGRVDEPVDRERFAEAIPLLEAGDREAALRALYEGYYGSR